MSSHVRVSIGVQRFSESQWPLVALLLASVLLIGLRGDLWWTDRLYAWEGGRWSLQSHWLVESVLHVGARRVSALAWLGVVLAWLVSLVRPAWRAWRLPLGYLALAVLLATSLVSLLKSISPLDCPWDLARYGGTHAWHDLLSPGVGMPGHCFPAGHASAGYAWLALFFFFSTVRPARRHTGFLIGLSAGLVFGLAQQLRGAHFLSHDLFAAAICWCVAQGLYQRMLAQEMA